MLRKGMHPMKRPRRPVKRKVASKKIVKRKKAGKAFNKIQAGLEEALAHVRAVPEWNAEDAAVFDQPRPSAGFAYQWAPFSSIVYMLSKGWSQVPYSRHNNLPTFTNFDGYVVYRDTALFQISSALVESELRLAEGRARDLDKDTRESYRMAGSMGEYPQHRALPIMPSSFMVSSDYEQYHDHLPPVDVSLTITLRVPPRWCDAANALNIAHGEYARRRIAQSELLISADDKGIFSPFELTVKKVEA